MRLFIPKRLTFKSVLFALLFAAGVGFITTSALADSVKPVKKITWLAYDSGDGAPGDTTDGGIRNPGNGH